jgi:hypothetical protein
MCRFGPDLVCSSPAGGHWYPAGKIKRLTMPPRTKNEFKKRRRRLLSYRRHWLFQIPLRAHTDMASTSYTGRRNSQQEGR